MLKVMIVDDMEYIRMQIKRLGLWGEHSGFQIAAEAEDGQEALNKLKQQPVDLLITDIRMPRINGIELLKEVNEESLAKCVVFLSEHGEFNLAKEAIQYGIFDYLVKPVNEAELRSLLEKAKVYIQEKAESQNQLKKLEDKLIERLEVYYPANQVKGILKSISEGDEKAVEACMEMAENTAAALEGDIIKTAIVLQRVYNDIWAGIFERNKWIEQYADIKAYTDLDLKQLHSIALIKDDLVTRIKSLLFTIKKFLFEKPKNPLIREICFYVIDNIEKDISISKISAALYLTKNYVGDLFKQETAMTLGDYITMVKLERAKKLIEEGQLKIYEIAQILGYNNAEYFAKLFKRNTKLSPYEYKNSLRNKQIY